MKKIYDEYKDATVDGKKIRVEPSKLTGVEEVNGQKKFIRKVELPLRKCSKRLTRSMHHNPL